MLKKIDCVMIRVDDVEAAARYYSDVFGLRPLWRDETSVGLGLPDTDAEIVLHCNPDIPSQVEIYYLVDDVVSAVRVLEQRGCRMLNGPFEIPIGQGAVINATSNLAWAKANHAQHHPDSPSLIGWHEASMESAQLP